MLRFGLHEPCVEVAHTPAYVARPQRRMQNPVCIGFRDAPFHVAQWIHVRAVFNLKFFVIGFRLFEMVPIKFAQNKCHRALN